MSITSLSESINLPLIVLLDLVIILGSLGVVFLRRIIYSALLLGLVFIGVALLYLVLNADFLAAAQVLIYVGAINVLIVFAIMLVNKPELNLSKKWTLGDILSLLVFMLLFILLAGMILSTSWIQVDSVATDTIISQKALTKSVDIIGIHLLTDLLLPFELLSVLLLVALVGAITVARKEAPM